MPGTLQNKGFQAKALLCVFWLIGIFGALQASANSPVNEDSLKGTVSLVSPFVYQHDSSVVVDNSQLKAGLLYDVHSQKIVWQKDMHKTLPIASLTKMMV